MALKFLNKKGWHTGSLRNIENVWKAEQKHDAEQKKLEELKKQILEERERSEFRLLQEQAGLVPKQERLDFLYDSGLAVGKGSSDGFKALQAPPPTAETDASASSSSKQQASVPGALFEDKPQSANDTWRKLHSDPLLLIRQREQDALARIKNNPVQMAMIRKSVEVKKKPKEKHERKEHKKKHRHKRSKHDKHSSRSQSDSEGNTSEEGGRRKRSKHDKHSSRGQSDSEGDTNEEGGRRKRSKHGKHSSRGKSDLEGDMSEGEGRRKRVHQVGEHSRPESVHVSENKRAGIADMPSLQHGSRHNKHRQSAPKLSAEERAARVREMQLDAELHEEQRWKRLKKASESDAREASRTSSSRGQNFLVAAQKSVYGTDKGGSSTIEESVRRRAYYSQGKSEAHDVNAFRR